METDIGIAVAVLYPDDDIADRCYSWTVTGELLVGHFCVKFLRLNELVVKIKVIFIVRQQRSSCQQCIDKRKRVRDASIYTSKKYRSSFYS